MQKAAAVGRKRMPMKTVDRDRYLNLGKTDRWLLDALLRLMARKRFDDLSIKEIAEEAGVDRRTFYRHFTSKTALFEVHMQLVFAEFGRYMEGRMITSYEMARAYFEFWNDHRAFVHVLEKHDLMYHFLKNYDNYMFQVARQAKPWNAEKDGHDFDPKIRYHFFYGMGGLWGMCYRWIVNGSKESPEALAQYVVSYFVESYEAEPECQHYARRGSYRFDPCYVTPNPADPPASWEK